MNSFPNIFPRQDKKTIVDSGYHHNGKLSSLEMTAAVNTSESVGRHIRNQAVRWSRRSSKIRPQLVQAGVDAEESEEFEEQLLSLSERYVR